MDAFLTQIISFSSLLVITASICVLSQVAEQRGYYYPSHSENLLQFEWNTNFAYA